MSELDRSKLIERVKALKEKGALNPTTQKWLDNELEIQSRGSAGRQASREVPRKGICVCAVYLAGGSIHQVAWTAQIRPATVSRYVKDRIPEGVRYSRPRNRNSPSLADEQVAIMWQLALASSEMDPIRLAARILQQSRAQLEGEEFEPLRSDRPVLKDDQS